MAYPDKIEEEAIYLSSGNPLPRDIDAIVASLNRDSFRNAFAFIWEMNTLKGYSLADILRDVVVVVVQVEYPNEVSPRLPPVLCLPACLCVSLSLPPTASIHPIPPSPQVLAHLYKQLADIEYHLAAGASEKLQLGALVGAFAYARSMLEG